MLQTGTHNELMARKGIYFGLVQQQEKQEKEKEASGRALG